ncbi:MAG: rod shape-determining protein RodA [Rhodospirillaceae bacterium]|jgi:rod shape determining protein RodA
MMETALGFNRTERTLRQKLWQLQWFFIFLICVIACVGFAMLYSAANGKFDPWATRQMVRFGVGFVAMLIVALTDIRIWLRYAYFFYIVTLLLLVFVEFSGTIGMGAQRWINLGLINLQPSEVMKITMILALARYFHGVSVDDVGRILYLLPPVLIIAVPTALVLRQPDLGTAVMLLIAGIALFWLAGVRLAVFVAMAVGTLLALPLAWQFLHDYQRKRVLIFLNPESDPLGGGYHIIQSKIALGSGGLFGKGFLQGSQSHLNFLPEKQTDFVFTMLAEEVGMVGGLGLIALYIIILIYGFAISLGSRNQFGRLIGLGITVTFFLYVFINIAMVTGLIPVVGVPLPLISYGGTAMMTVLIGFGLLLGVHVHRDIVIGRRSSGEEF